MIKHITAICEQSFTLFEFALTLSAQPDVLRVAVNAFVRFNEDTCGFIAEHRLRDLLTKMGDRFTNSKVDKLSR